MYKTLATDLCIILKNIILFNFFFLHYLHNHHRLQDFSPFGALRHFIKNSYVMQLNFRVSLQSCHWTQFAASTLHLTTFSVLLLQNSVNIPKGQRSADALQKTFLRGMQVIHDFIVVKAPTRPVHVHAVRKQNTEGVTETAGQTQTFHCDNIVLENPNQM